MIRLFGIVLLLVACATSMSAAEQPSASRAPVGQPVRLSPSARLVLTIQFDTDVDLTLIDPHGRRARFSFDGTDSQIPGCETESWSVDDVTDDDSSMTAPHGAFFIAHQPEVGGWRLAALLPPEAEEPSFVRVSASIDSMGTSESEVTLKPGYQATWVLRVSSSGGISGSLPRVSTWRKGVRTR